MPISKATVASAVKRFYSMSFDERMVFIDRLMTESRDFLGYAIGLKRIGVPVEKLEYAIEAGVCLALCHEEQHRVPLPHVSLEMMDGHFDKVVAMIDRGTKKGAVEKSRTIEDLVMDHPEVNVWAWLWGTLTDAGIMKLEKDEDVQVVLCVLTQLSVFTELQRTTSK